MDTPIECRSNLLKNSHQTFICGGEGAAKSAVYRDRSRTLNELKAAVTVYIRNVSQADLQKVFANKIKLDATLAVLFISNCKITLNVSDAFCAHHQEYQKL
jgi:hypothetical protein